MDFQIEWKKSLTLHRTDMPQCKFLGASNKLHAIFDIHYPRFSSQWYTFNSMFIHRQTERAKHNHMSAGLNRNVISSESRSICCSC